MKKLNFIALLVCLLAVFSCSKENIDYDANTKNQGLFKNDSIGEYRDSVYYAPDGAVYTYYLNNVKKKTIEFTPTYIDEEAAETSYLFINPIIKNGSLAEVQIREFTTLTGYEAYGKSVNPDFATFLNFEAKALDFIESNDLEKEYLTTGQVPATYEAWYQSTYSQEFNRVPFPVTLYKNLDGGPAWLCPTGQSLFMMPGWNNVVSRYMALNIYGCMTVYDKAFYRKKIGTIKSWGWTYVYFWGPLGYFNDKMSSFISF